MIFRYVAFVVMLVLGTSASLGQEGRSVKRPEGFVPNESTAITIAEAVLAPIYGPELIAKERPFTATLNGDTWTVKGSLPKAGPDEIVMGGVAIVKISKRNGCILLVGHSQ